MAFENIEIENGEAARLGTWMAEPLRHAVDKYAEVQNLDPENIFGNPGWRIDYSEKYQRRRTYGQTVAWVALERQRQETKLAWRQSDAEKFIGQGLIVRLVDPQTEQTAGQGELVGLSLPDASVTLLDDGGAAEVPFATPAPIPEHIRQTHYGTRLTVAFQVLEIPDESAWLFHQAPVF